MNGPSTDARPSCAQVYQDKRAKHEAAAEDIASRSRLVSNLRGLSFGVFVIAALWGLFGGAPQTGGLIALGGLVAFLALITVHGRVLAREETERRFALVNAHALARVTGRFRELPEDGSSLKPAAHPYADDLDVFGPGSLFQRLSTAHTTLGKRHLAAWLSVPASPELISARQEAVRELAPALSLRQSLEALALFAVTDPTQSTAGKVKRAPDPEPFVAWAESAPTLLSNTALVWGSRILPVLTMAALAGLIWAGLPTWAFTLPLIVQLVILYKTRDATSRAFNAVSTSEGAFSRYGSMLRLVEGQSVEARLLQELKAQLTAGGKSPSQAMRVLGRAVGWFELRHNGLVHPFANALLLWDVHCVLMLEAWQRESGKAARMWLERLGELEALASFAAFAHDDPKTCFPSVEADKTLFEARALAHPLLEADKRVENDVTLPSGSTSLLVTGSNMSGKSTMLRAMGLAAVMAQSGAPVCAESLRLGPFAVRTSIRISDSLERGVSHFYAEVEKLSAVMNATAGGPPVFFLLDEILHGTNSRERQIGARWVLAELLERGATGAISTHDMELCRLPEELMQKVQLVHFRENVKDGKMTFDFKLREGPVTAGNALRLMQLAGLDVPLE
ncbi:MAG TPA: DNA mismatch repair protein MutS [Polyangiaceae bacterium]|nr:DNA mismatch repair protein MutS [Polyangiaceae bacterium]